MPGAAAVPNLGRWRWSDRAALVVAGSVTVTVLASSSAPTPLYATYEAQWGFSALTTTIVFGVYAVAVLASLLVFGRLSDHVGRRPVLAAALGLQVVAMAVLAFADGAPELLLGRVLQGLSTGAAVGAAGGAMLDLDRRRGTVANSVAPPVGTAAGAVLSAVVVQALPWPTHLVYLVLLGVYVLQLLALLRWPETVAASGRADRSRALASLVPRVVVPRALRGAYATAATVVFAVWALAGFYGSLAPQVVATVLSWNSPAAGASTLFLQTALAVVSVVTLREASARFCVQVAAAALTLGMGLTLLALHDRSAALFFLGTAAAGLGFGAGFQGGIRTVVPLAAPADRAGVLSSVYTAAYLGLGVPAVVAGVLVVHGGGLLPTTREYAVAVMVLALLASIGSWRTTSRTASTPTPITGGNP
ncbi:MFS transporter [Kineococcus sp. SYSU DK003]|uniref:MFS transporter n=1 Tax=Kineococcus sp. SYSU DK003 TaxID=3383124 RepID=UPI003D7EFEE8